MIKYKLFICNYEECYKKDKKLLIIFYDATIAINWYLSIFSSKISHNQLI